MFKVWLIYLDSNVEVLIYNSTDKLQGQSRVYDETLWESQTFFREEKIYFHLWDTEKHNFIVLNPWFSLKIFLCTPLTEDEKSKGKKVIGFALTGHPSCAFIL